MNKTSLYTVLAAAALTSCATQNAAPPASTPTTALASGVLRQNFDSTVRPQDDFYRHVNGAWLTNTPIPPDRSNYGAFSMLEEASERNLRTILEEASTARAPAGSDMQKIGDFYASFMDAATIEARGLAPLQEEFARIDAMKSTRDLAHYIGRTQRLFVAQPFAFFIGIDEKNSTRYVSNLFQNGLGMPDRDYYLAEEPRLKVVREKYRVYIRDLLAAAGATDAEQAAEQIFELETKMAQAHWTRVQNRDAEKTYNRYERAALPKLMPAFDWSAFMTGMNAPTEKIDAMVVAQPSFFEALDRLIVDTPLPVWKRYLRFKLLNAWAPDLTEQFVNLHFEFNQRTVSGIEELKPRWKRGVDTVEAAVGDLAGKVYVERHFSPEAKRRMDELVGNLLQAYRDGINDLEWMTPATKEKAQAKLARFTTKIGYPAKWRDWSALEVRRDDLIGNEMRAAAAAFDRDLKKLGGPIDKTEWFMTPQTVNAYYYPAANEIVFPAAILQPPFFNVNADDAINYGAIGAVIGPEISHGFDDQGRRYDGEGNLNDWWAPQDNEEFTARARQLGAQYAALSPIPGLTLNPELTMGENIADVAGLAMAWRAYQLSLKSKPAPTLDGFTGDQRFFIGWAQGWARNYREDELRKRLMTDPHSPSEYRTNAVVANLPQFHRAFGVQPGDKMYRAPEAQVRIW